MLNGQNCSWSWPRKEATLRRKILELGSNNNLAQHRMCSIFFLSKSLHPIIPVHWTASTWNKGSVYWYYTLQYTPSTYTAATWNKGSVYINDTVYTPSTHTASSWIKGPVYCIIGWSDIVLFASMHYLILFTQHSVIRYLQIIAFSLTMVVFQYKYKADQNLKIHHDHWSVISILNLL